MAPEAQSPFRTSNFSHWEKEAFLRRVRKGSPANSRPEQRCPAGRTALPWGKPYAVKESKGQVKQKYFLSGGDDCPWDFSRVSVKTQSVFVPLDRMRY